MQLGIEALLTRHTSWLKHARVGLLSHQAAATRGGATTAQRLQEALGDRLVALFGPEHGFFGLAGPGVLTHCEPHPEWGIPVYSLYGEHRSPAREMLEGIDVVVIDFQDLGARCYTYLATMRRMLEAAAKAGIRVVVADRPIPLPHTVDGPPLEAAYRSFVADAPLPMAYGMTPGETSRWLSTQLGLALDLNVARCTGWRRQASFLPDSPEWIPPSPGIRTLESAQTYLTTVFTEAVPSLDCGRTTNLAFRVLGAPWLDAPRLCDALRQTSQRHTDLLGGVAFHPHRYVAGPGDYSESELNGVRITVTDALRFRPVTVSVALLDHIARQHGPERVWGCAGARPAFFDKLYGSDQTRRALEAGTSWDAVVAGWEPSLASFRNTRDAALLYGTARVERRR